MATPTTGAAVKVTRVNDTVEWPQLKPTTKGALEPKSVGRPILADLPLGVNLLVDMDAVAETTIIGVKVFPHREKLESFHLAEVYMLGGPMGGDVAYMGSLMCCRVDFPEGKYDIKHDDEIVRQVRELLLPGPKGLKG